MNPNHIAAFRALEKSQLSLNAGDKRTARTFAEQAAMLAPDLEEVWLMLAALASPRASVAYLKKALEINPNSERGLKGLRWAEKRVLAEQPAPASQPSVAPVRSNPPKPNQTPRITKKSASVKEVLPKRLILFVLIFGLISLIGATWAWPMVTQAVALASGNTEQAAGFIQPESVQIIPTASPTFQPTELPVLLLSTATSFPSPVAALPTATNIPPTSIPTLSASATSVPTTIPSQTPEPSPTSIPTETPWPTAVEGYLTINIVPPTEIPPTTVAPTYAAPAAPSSNASTGERWVEVNLSQQMLYAWDGDTLVGSFVVSTGTWQYPTVTGTYRVYARFKYKHMSGPGYSLPDVPNTMFFYQGYAIHGTYWHNNFGTPMSHGCVNMTIPDSEWLYNWAPSNLLVNVHY